MNDRHRRPLSLNNLRAFEAVARTLSFGNAADELFITPSAMSRQIKGLEDELGAALFSRGTRHVHLTAEGQTLLRAVEPLLARLDAGVQQIRRARSRPKVNITTFASFGSLWLLPRIEAFQRRHADIDIRVSAADTLADLDDLDLDLALRYCAPASVPPGGSHLFDESLTPVVGRGLWERIGRGEAPPLAVPADLAGHTLLEEDDDRAMTQYLSWQRWLDGHGHGGLQPQRWLYLNFTYQQVQAALAGHGVALARLPLVFEALQRGDLVEPFGPAGRIGSPFSYWLLTAPGSRARPEVAEFCAWVEAEAEATRAATASTSAEPERALSARRAR